MGAGQGLFHLGNVIGAIFLDIQWLVRFELFRSQWLHTRSAGTNHFRSQCGVVG